VESYLMEYEEWNGEQDLTGWWMREKLNGIRAYWDGEKLYSKDGKEYLIPSYFGDGLPPVIPLDGELYLNNGGLNRLTSIINSKDADWKNVKYVVFDLPFSNDPYESRMEELKKLSFPDHVNIATSKQCEGMKHFWDSMNSVLRNGGQGMVLYKPQSKYSSCKSDSVLQAQVVKYCVYAHFIKRSEDAQVKLIEVVQNGLKCEQ
jgi:DNA ligase-1